MCERVMKKELFIFVFLLIAGSSFGQYADTSKESVSCIFGNTVKNGLVRIEEKNDQLPNEYALYQNYQSLSDRSTRIYFDLTEPGYTKLTIFNFTGQKKETVISEYKEAGRYQFVWEGEGYQKEKYYLCKLQVSDAESGKTFFESIIKILLR
jgi:hypothetical protein